MMSFHMKRHATLAGFAILTVFMSYTALVSAHGWVAPKEASKIENPAPLTEPSIGKGKETFLQFCAHCHGTNGQGLTAKTAKIKKNPPNLIERLQHHSDGDFHWKIMKGKDEMPSFQEDLSKMEVWDLINYIKTLE